MAAFRHMHGATRTMWARNPRIGGLAFNARLSAAPRKPAFSGAWKARRCLIPASGFYEWRAVDTDGKPDADKMPFYISRKDGLPFTFAGLWRAGGTAGVFLHDPHHRCLRRRWPISRSHASLAWARGALLMPSCLAAALHTGQAAPIEQGAIHGKHEQQLCPATRHIVLCRIAGTYGSCATLRVPAIFPGAANAPRQCKFQARSFPVGPSCSSSEQESVRAYTRWALARCQECRTPASPPKRPYRFP